MATDAIREPFAVINADDFYGADSYRVLAGHLKSGTPDYAMVGFQLSKTLSDFGSVARGICQSNSGGYLETIVEMTSIEYKDGTIANTDSTGNVTPLTGDELVSMNMWGLHPTAFRQLAAQFEAFLKQSGSELKTESYLPSTVNALVQLGVAKVKVLETASAWFGVTYREDRPTVVDRIAQLVAAGEYPCSLWA
jgi:hypothetical protein